MQISPVVNTELVLYKGNGLGVIITCLLSQFSSILSIFETSFKITIFAHYSLGIFDLLVIL